MNLSLGLLDHHGGQKTTTKWWWWTDELLMKNKQTPLQPTLGLSGPHKKISKNIMKLGTCR